MRGGGGGGWGGGVGRGMVNNDTVLIPGGNLVEIPTTFMRIRMSAGECIPGFP